jgi:hypothetical protein
MEDRPRFPRLEAIIERVWDDREELATDGIHLLVSRYDERNGGWIELGVVTTDANEAQRVLRERYSDLIRVEVIGTSLTEDVATPWRSYRTDASQRTVYVRYATSGYHRGARVDVAESSDSVTITLIETRSVGPYGPVGAYREEEARLENAARRPGRDRRSRYCKHHRVTVLCGRCWSRLIAVVCAEVDQVLAADELRASVLPLVSLMQSS